MEKKTRIINDVTYRSKRESVLLLAHSRIFFFSQPSTVFTHSSPGLRQSFDMNGIARKVIAQDGYSTRVCKPRAILRPTIKLYYEHTSLFHGRSMFARKTIRSVRFTSRLRSTAHGFVLLTSLSYQLCN